MMNIVIPKECTAIYLLFSGGMDSSLLLYLIAEKIHEEKLNIPIFCVTFGTNYSTKAVKEVFEYVKNKFPIKMQVMHKKGNFLIRDITKKLLMVDTHYVYSGCNKVVENEFFPTKYIKNDTPPVRGEPYSEKHLRPFINIDKRNILQIYVEKDILSLLDITHSCGISKTEHCGECYFCMEKNWALEAFNLFYGEQNE